MSELLGFLGFKKAWISEYIKTFQAFQVDMEISKGSQHRSGINTTLMALPKTDDDCKEFVLKLLSSTGTNYF